MRLHNSVFIAGFAATHALSLWNDTVPFWPIYWSQTGLWDQPFNHLLFMCTTAMTSVLVIHEHRLMSDLSKPRNRFGVIGSVCFCALGIINSNSSPARQIHGAFTMLAGLFMVLFIVSSEPPSLRWSTAAYFALLFAVEFVLKKTAPWTPGEHSYSDASRLMLQISSVAQWLQLGSAMFFLEHL
jgi:hypothetical protein